MIKRKYLIRLYTNLIKFAFKRCLLFHIIGSRRRPLTLKHLVPMGTREKLFRQKLAGQLEILLNHSEKVFSAEKLDQEWIANMISETQELTSVLTIYQFLHELPEDANLQLEFLELQDLEKQESTPPVPNYREEILKEVEEFETQIAQDAVIEEEVVDSIPEPVIEEETSAPVEIEKESIPVPEDPKIEVQEIIEEPIAEKNEEIAEVEEEIPEPVAEKQIIQESTTTEEDVVEINDAVAQNSTSLADKLRSKSIQKLADSIALNERFLYSNELFNGNMEAFKRALNELDHIASLDDATRYMEVQLKVEHSWNEESTTVQQFIQLVERRFN